MPQMYSIFFRSQNSYKNNYSGTIKQEVAEALEKNKYQKDHAQRKS